MSLRIVYMYNVCSCRHFYSVESWPKVLILQKDQLDLCSVLLLVTSLFFMLQAYLHSRMRARTNALLKILNRARPEAKTTEKKTISWALPLLTTPTSPSSFFFTSLSLLYSPLLSPLPDPLPTTCSPPFLPLSFLTSSHHPPLSPSSNPNPCIRMYN